MISGSPLIQLLFRHTPQKPSNHQRRKMKKFDNLILQSVLSRLNNPSPNTNFPSLEDLLLDNLNLLDSDEEEDEEDVVDPTEYSSLKSLLSREESKLEKQIIRTILSGETEKLKPNSGQAVTIGEHQICMGFQVESGSDYRVWEWHGHVMLFDEENGYSPEYIYGNYFERINGGAENKMKKDLKRVSDEKLGLKELFGSGNSNGGRIVHRNMNANSGSSSSITSFPM